MLPWPYRLFFWGVHGVFVEVAFTGLWEFAASGNWTLKGYSSIWSFFTYGLGAFLALEYLHSRLKSLKMHWLLRCVVYVVGTYLWEFSCGLILSYFNACPWDYTAFTYNTMGLITLEYAPLWFLGALYFEVLINIMQRLEEVPEWKRLKSA